MEIQGEWNASIFRGLKSNRLLLSCKHDGSNVDLYSRDNGSGRQRLVFELIPGIADIHHIFVSGGVHGSCKFLSTEGINVDLFTKDNESGRQRWQLQTGWEA